MSALRGLVLADLAEELAANDRRWGGPEHDDAHDRFGWASFIEAKLRTIEKKPLTHEQYRQKLLQIAAHAVAAIESDYRTQPFESGE